MSTSSLACRNCSNMLIIDVPSEPEGPLVEIVQCDQCDQYFHVDLSMLYMATKLEEKLGLKNNKNIQQPICIGHEDRPDDVPEKDEEQIRNAISCVCIGSMPDLLPYMSDAMRDVAKALTKRLEEYKNNPSFSVIAKIVDCVDTMKGISQVIYAGAVSFETACDKLEYTNVHSDWSDMVKFMEGGDKKDLSSIRDVVKEALEKAHQEFEANRRQK